MTLQTYLSELEASERTLKLEANTVSERDYEKLVAYHLHLIAASKKTKSRKRNVFKTSAPGR